MLHKTAQFADRFRNLLDSLHPRLRQFFFRLLKTSGTDDQLVLYRVRSRPTGGRDQGTYVDLGRNLFLVAGVIDRLKSVTSDKREKKISQQLIPINRLPDD